MAREVKVGSTSQTEYFYIVSSTTGLPMTTLAYNTSGLIAYYNLNKGAAVSITLATQTPSGAYSAGGLCPVDATNEPGVYRFDPPDAAYASGTQTVISLSGVTGMLCSPLKIPLVAYDPQNATTLGLTNLDATVSSRSTYAGADTAGTTTLLSRIGSTIAFYGTNVKVSLEAILGTTLTETVGFLAAGFKKFFNITTPTLTVGGIDQTGDAFARLGAAGVGLTNLGDTRIAHLDADVSSRLATSGYTAPDNADVATILGIVNSGSFGNSALLTAIQNITNLSALANIFGPGTMARPASGNIVYPFTFVVKDEEGHLVDVDSNTVTLTAKNGAGTDRSTNLSAVTHAGTGQYTFTYTVHSSDVDEGLAFTATGTVQSASRVGFASSEVADADSLAALAAIQAKTDNLPASPASTSDVTSGTSAVETAITTAQSAINSHTDSAVAPLATTSELNAVKAKTDNLPASPASTGDVTSSTSTLAADISAGTSSTATAITSAQTAINAHTDTAVNPLATTAQITAAVSALEAAITAATSPLATSVALATAQTGISAIQTIVDQFTFSGGLVNANIDSSTFAAAIWNALTASYMEDGSFGQAVGLLAGNTNPWDLLTAGHDLANTFGQFIQQQLAQLIVAMLSGQPIIITNPLSKELNFSVRQGISYNNADGDAPVWTLGPTPNLTGVTVELLSVDGLSLIATATVLTSGAADQTVTLNLTGTQTAAFPDGATEYILVALISGLKHEMAKGAMTVVPI